MDGGREQRHDRWPPVDPDAAVVQRLLRQAYLFDDPEAYEAGVRDALAAVRAGDGRVVAA